MPDQILVQEVDGFGVSTQSELQELRKALSIGYTLPVTGNDAIRVESLESTLKLLTYAATNLRLWNTIEKIDAYSSVEEYNRLVAYGQDAGGFNEAGVLPEEEDSTYERTSQFVKYAGTTRSVAHPTTLIRTVPADIIMQETNNGALYLMGKINKSLYYGDADSIPVEWNGITKQIVDGAPVTAPIFDLRGAALTQSNIENAAQQIVNNFGMPQAMFANGRVFADFSKLYYSSQRFNNPPSPTPGVAGTPLTGFHTVNGLINFNPDVFVKQGGAPPSVATHAKAPNAPTVNNPVPAGTGSKFTAADAGNYLYKITAVNSFGESAPSAATAAINYVAGNSATFTITTAGAGTGETGYKVYRTFVEGTTVFYVG